MEIQQQQGIEQIGSAIRLTRLTQALASTKPVGRNQPLNPTTCTVCQPVPEPLPKAN